MKQSAKDTVASALASIPAAAPKKNMMPSMMASIADIAKKAKARPVCGSASCRGEEEYIQDGTGRGTRPRIRLQAPVASYGAEYL